MHLSPEHLDHYWEGQECSKRWGENLCIILPLNFRRDEHVCVWLAGRWRSDACHMH